MKNILIKGSGDVTDKKEFINSAIEIAKKNYVVLICGGGTKISSALKDAGYDIKFDSLGRRITKTWKERLIMRDALEIEENKLQNRFVGKGITVIPPILYAASVLCPINGDDLVRAYELGFDEIQIYTTKERVEKKRQEFLNIEKVTVF